MTAWPNRANLSIEEYLHLDQGSSEARYEYIDGYVMR
jgi:Uma2 family endonuclease